MTILFRSKGWATLLGLTLLLALAAAAVACGGEEEEGEIKDIHRSPDTPIVIPAGEPIVVGVSAALTGPTETQGTESRDATIVGVARWKEANGDQIKGHDIEVHTADDGCFESDITALAAERLLGREGLVGVIGPQCSGGALAVIPIYAEAGVVAISGSATRTDLTTGQPENGFFFRTAFRNDLEGTFIGLFLVGELQAEKVYMIDDSEPFGIDLADSAQAIAEAGGVTVVRESIEQGAVDFSELAAKIAADAPDFVAFTGFNPEGALLYRQLRDAGYSGPFIGSDGTAVVSDFVEPLGELAEGVVFAGCSLTLPEEFLADYVDIIGGEPVSAFPAQYADAATILLDAVAEVAVEQADGSLVIEPLELRDAVSTPKEFTGLSGVIAFDKNGDRVGQSLGVAMCEVKDGEFVNLES